MFKRTTAEHNKRVATFCLVVWSLCVSAQLLTFTFFQTAIHEVLAVGETTRAHFSDLWVLQSVILVVLFFIILPFMNLPKQIRLMFGVMALSGILLPAQMLFLSTHGGVGIAIGVASECAMIALYFSFIESINNRELD